MSEKIGDKMSEKRVEATDLPEDVLATLRQHQDLKEELTQRVQKIKTLLDNLEASGKVSKQSEEVSRSNEEVENKSDAHILSTHIDPIELVSILRSVSDEVRAIISYYHSKQLEQKGEEINKGILSIFETLVKDLKLVKFQFGKN